jgi:hypothetical protein
VVEARGGTDHGCHERRREVVVDEMAVDQASGDNVAGTLICELFCIFFVLVVGGVLKRRDSQSGGCAVDLGGTVETEARAAGSVG